MEEKLFDGESAMPSEQNMIAWYSVIERVLAINNRPWPTNKAYAPEPLPADIQDSVDRNLLMATRVEGSKPGDRFILTVVPNGQAAFDMLHAQLVATGQAYPRCDEESATKRTNPFDGIDD